MDSHVLDACVFRGVGVSVLATPLCEVAFPLIDMGQQGAVWCGLKRDSLHNVGYRSEVDEVRG